jgi:bifunctional UDP-N-acetylglucosamine pyrophosphorylase/glucosamine-1-phosphate N-acetyltransferase
MNQVCALILAAGKGTRMKSQQAKVLHPLLGRPLIRFPVQACREAGVAPVVCVVGHQAKQVRDALPGADLAFALQAEQHGTGHAALCARESLQGFTGTALILCGDVPLLRAATLTRLTAHHAAAGAAVTVLSMRPAEPSGYGRLVRDATGALQGIVEQRDCTPEQLGIDEVNTGTYAVELPWLWEALARVGNANSQGEYYLTDVVAAAAAEGRAASLLLEDPEEVMGINSRTHLAEAAAVMRRRINRDWMEAGVTLEDPDSTWIGPGVVLEPDARVGPHCRLEGSTRVAAGARLDQGVVATDCAIGAGAHIKPYCVLAEAEVGPDTQVGPFAHLRPGAEMLAGSRVGNFVEMKKTTLGAGSKANHLTYLGDTVVGQGANIGAGTITCNYDGVNKHRTVIGDGAFIGSNASLVAPVTIGAEATVAAGSTVTQDVPDQALGVARGKQRNLDGWVARRPRKKK